MDLLGKLQVKSGQSIAVVGGVPEGVDDWNLSTDPDTADAVLLYVSSAAELAAAMGQLQQVADRGAQCWLAYPRAGRHATDLNRDRIRESVVGLNTVRQVAVDDVWSALRLTSL